jgi:hypothetical protein
VVAGTGFDADVKLKIGKGKAVADDKDEGADDDESADDTA